MTLQEFNGWKALTARSTGRWMQDLITYANRGKYLFFKGGEDGDFIWVHTTGVAELGTYAGALPHIGEAAFRVTSSKQHFDKAMALKAVYRAIPELRAAVTR